LTALNIDDLDRKTGSSDPVADALGCIAARRQKPAIGTKRAGARMYMNFELAWLDVGPGRRGN
jgi:hypothetical protein